MGKSNRYKENWAETEERFEKWWRREPTDRPLICLTAPREKPLTNAPTPAEPPLPGKYLDIDYLISSNRRRLEATYFGAEAFPVVDANLGPGSLAIYLGSEPRFEPDTVWFEPCIGAISASPLPQFNPENRWFKLHLEIIRGLQEAFGSDAWVAIPDLIESLDILAAMRGPSQLLYDLIDHPDDCLRWLRRINELYFPHYDAFYSIVKGTDGSSVFTAFRIWGPGKVCKVQCDFSAMISTKHFEEFFVPFLIEQLSGVDRAMYHLDGPDAIRHVDQLLRLERLHGIQWTPGAGKPNCGDPVWFPLYKKILDSGKGLQVSMPIGKVEPFIRRFGATGLYVMTSAKTERDANELLIKIEKPKAPRPG